MRRKTGPADISYCNTNCCQENCRRNLRYWKPPTKFYSVSNFDEDCKDAIHSNCEHKWLAEEDSASERVKKTTNRKS